MRVISIVLLLVCLAVTIEAFRPRYWRLNRHGRWKTSAWGSSEEAGYYAGLQAAGMTNVAPSYYAQQPSPGSYGGPPAGFNTIYGGPARRK